MTIIDPSAVMLQMDLVTSPTDREKALAEMAVRAAESSIKRHLQYDPAQASRTEYYPLVDRTQSSRGRWEADASNAYWRSFSGGASEELCLRHLPLRGSTEPRVYVDYTGRFGKGSGAFAAETEKTIGTDFWPQYDGADDNGDEVCRDGILRSIGLWPEEPGSIKVIYTAGYSAAELEGNGVLVDAHPIWEVALEEACRRMKRALLMWGKQTGAGHAAGPFTSENLGDYSYSVDSSVSQRIFGGADLLDESKQRLADYVNYGFQMAGG